MSALSWQRSPYQVVVRNERGEERTVIMTADYDEAKRMRDQTVRRIDLVGARGWAHEMRNCIPASFFTHADP
jgi:hypothetical protein